VFLQVQKEKPPIGGLFSDGLSLALTALATLPALLAGLYRQRFFGLKPPHYLHLP
jgi:hypothetical protein